MTPRTTPHHLTEHQHAIIGCGRVAANHVDGIRRVPGWGLAVACDRIPEVAADFARDHLIARTMADAQEVFAAPEISSVSVTVDHAQHAELTERALLAGKHVLVEKPICLDPAEGRRLVALAEHRGLVLSVVAQHRYDPVVLAVRDWVRRGLLGELLQVSVALQAARAKDYYQDSYWRGTLTGEGGSALVNQGYHCLDAVRWICGDVRAVAASCRTVAFADVIETEDTLSGLLAAGPVPVTLNVTVAGRIEWRSRIEVVGTAGSVVFDLDHPGRLQRFDGSAELVRLAELEQSRTPTEAPAGLSYYGVSHRAQIADFCHGVATGEPMLSSAGDAVGTLEAILALYALGGRRQPAAALTALSA
ncbi:UDP-N-acetyl-2-amino-2-deoxyglucuronate dehydrogenase [Streptacidiphilus sp. MAP12-20]|uniref:Gfo/Idh/MocA family protein n=1 Tax=Streptacidiphilus sp. MAP12-20 TaxID=3156299 RepID=UPI0035192153